MSERPPLSPVRRVTTGPGAAAVAGPNRGRPAATSPVTWATAHKIAHVAAAKAHASLRVDLSGVSVDVLSAIGVAGLPVIWRPAPAIFGAYLNESGSRPGIMLNSGLPRPARRHTAAHELGHAFLQHTTTVDDGSSIDIAAGDETDWIPLANRRRTWPDQEKLAEAFAAWFLMPRRVVRTALGVLGVERPRGPVDTYRLASLLGTSYRTTVRHLPNLRLVDGATAAAWGRVAPHTLKAKLDAGVPRPSSRRHDVWLVDPRHAGLVLPVCAGDRVAIDAGPGAESVGAPAWLEFLGETPVPRAASAALRVAQVYQCTPASSGTGTITVPPGMDSTPRGRDAGWSLTLRAYATPTGIDPRSAA